MTAATEGITTSSSCGSSSSQFPYKHCNEVMMHIYLSIYIIGEMRLGHLPPCCLPSQLHEKSEVQYLMDLPDMMLAVGKVCKIGKRPRKFEIWKTHVRSKKLDLKIFQI